MVVPSSANRKRTKRRRGGNTDILVAIAVTVIVVGVAWIVTLSLLAQSNSAENIQRDAPLHQRWRPRSEESGKRGESSQKIDATSGEMHLSAKAMLATKRPYLIYGTAWKEDATSDLVFQAVHAGFRFIDTACQPKHYNEPGVGLGWKMAADQLGLTREDIFLQTKFTSVNGQDPENMPYVADARLEDQVQQSVHASLRNLKTDYIDSFVLHSPMPKMKDTMKVWEVLEGLVEEKKIRQLGISNCYDPNKFKQIYEKATIKPKVLQNRFHDKSGFDIELRNLCNNLGVRYQSFWTLTANRRALASQDWKAMARQKGLTPQTLMYAFMMTLGHTPLDGTTDTNHMEEDVELYLRFQRGEKVLDEEEMDKLSSLLGIQ